MARKEQGGDCRNTRGGRSCQVPEANQGPDLAGADQRPPQNCLQELQAVLRRDKTEEPRRSVSRRRPRQISTQRSAGESSRRPAEKAGPVVSWQRRQVSSVCPGSSRTQPVRNHPPLPGRERAGRKTLADQHLAQAQAAAVE